MSHNQCESVAVSVESLLSDAKRMQTQCRERSQQLSMAATQLRVESAALREQCECAQLDMAQIRRQLDDLMDTKSAFEAKERQARKLSRHLLLIFSSSSVFMASTSNVRSLCRPQTETRTQFRIQHLVETFPSPPLTVFIVHFFRGQEERQKP
ncbi:hypothetical protein EYF80_027370 [Liparis tanakae]|uniref:Uncharacterized protein n=1 Tax=Liparis tanakae TaxID=230148 RepID=A0A4Z2HCG4_9TELE|nr:hypothetical protein EYF80_027370 [Liparis tanakae]